MQPVSNSPITRIPTVAPGKSGMAVGQIAKKTVQTAIAAGIELPRNAQGVAASAIARGADPASLFAAQVAGAVEDKGVTPDAAISAFTFNEPAIRTEPLAPADRDVRLSDE